MRRILAGVAVVIAISPALAAAQGQTAVPQPGPSLADVARAEEARRNSVGKPSKIYTNNDLRPDFTNAVPPPPSPNIVLAPDPAAGNASVGAPGAAATPDATPSQRDQAYWSSRIGEARAALDRSQVFADALQSRINGLNTDFVNRDDPAQRAVIDADRKKALAELDRVRKEIDDARKRITDIEEEARRAGVPPGWLR